ncbi:hypothetical protein KC19_8G061000 [Ceratodon purpureus]|uniref:Uncharacterized protein n=1 Tax=Ceratodon purpureus TaxID=3225 RepID=A0A8T0GVP1_CERPU|nr:hypothetical protein KC19_8G061000 [Ceratodon purpureus]
MFISGGRGTKGVIRLRIGWGKWRCLQGWNWLGRVLEGPSFGARLEMRPAVGPGASIVGSDGGESTGLLTCCLWFLQWRYFLRASVSHAHHGAVQCCRIRECTSLCAQNRDCLRVFGVFV